MTAKARILLIDDESLVRDELGGLLEDEGYEVICGSDGHEGLELFRQEQPDMVITDVRIPRSDGLSLAMAIRELSPATPVTIITGHGSEQMAIKALRAGVTDFLKKPVRLDDLASALLRMETARLIPHREPANLPSSAHLVEHCWTYELQNDLDAIPSFVDVVLSTCTSGFPRQGILELSLALRELLLNALEHGNLGLTYEEKTTALDEGTLDEMLAKRGSRPPFANRRARVVTRRGDEHLVVEIIDEGNGFDWRALPDPTDVDHLLEGHGRGVLLARMSVDKLEYNDKGNKVTIRKRFKGDR